MPNYTPYPHKTFSTDDFTLTFNPNAKVAKIVQFDPDVRPRLSVDADLIPDIYNTLGATALAVYLACKLHADASGHVDPDFIPDTLNISDRTCRKYIRMLDENGWIIGGSDGYRLPYDDVEDK